MSVTTSLAFIRLLGFSSSEFAARFLPGDESSEPFLDLPGWGQHGTLTTGQVIRTKKHRQKGSHVSPASLYR